MVSVNLNTKTLSGIINGSFDSADVSSLSVSSLTVSSVDAEHLTVSGNSSLSGVSCSSCSASGALSAGSLSVSGVAALAGVTCSSCTASGGLTESTLNISGTSTQGTINCTTCTATGGVNISTGQSYKVNSVDVLSASSLGSSVTSSSLTSIGTQAAGVNIASGQTYKINGTSVLSAATLQSGVTASSLTSVGKLLSLDCSGTITTNSTISATGSINSSTSYQVGGVQVLSGSSLGTGVTGSSLTSLGTLSSLTVSGNITQSSGTTSLLSPTITLSGASDVVTIQNTTAHPSISLKGTSTQHGYIGFFDNLGATKGSVYCSSTRAGVVVDVGSMTSGFLVQKSGTTVASVDPSGNVVANGNLTVSGTTSAQAITANDILTVSPALAGGTGLQVNSGNIDVSLGNINVSSGNSYKVGGTVVLNSSTLGSGVTSSSLTSLGTQAAGVNIATGQSYKVNGTSVLNATTLGSGVTSSSLTSVGTLGSLSVSGNSTVSGTSFTGGGIADATVLTQGTYTAWNISGGTGEANFVTKCGTGTGGFQFYNSTGNGSTFATGKTQLAKVDSSGITVPAGGFTATTGSLNLPSGNIYCNGYGYFNTPSIKIYRSGGWSVSNGEVVTKGGTVTFERTPSGSSGYSSSTGTYTVPQAGIWRFSLYVRCADGAGSLSLKPATSAAYSIPNSDASYWVPTDGGNRRTMTWTETTYMGTSWAYMCYSGQATTIQDFVFSGEFVGY